MARTKGQQTNNRSFEMKIGLLLLWALFLFTAYAGMYILIFAVFQLLWLM